MLEQVWSLFDRIIKATSEEQVIHELVNSHASLCFDNSRYYDVNECPFDHIHFYALRDMSRTYAKAQPGYRIYDATMTEDRLSEGEPVWESCDCASVQRSAQKQQWVLDLELEGQGWVDVPVIAGRHAVGLWALDRNLKLEPSDTEKNTLRRIANTAALRVRELRQARINALAMEMFSLHPTEDRIKESVQFCLTETCKTLNAGCVAYFSYDPIHDVLEKFLEVYRDGDEIKLVEDKKVDLQYRAGERLTGTAWVDESMLYVPDFARLCEKKPALADPGSVSLHERLLRTKLTSVVYQRINVPGANPGLLRAMNRADNSRMAFTFEHRGILERIAYPFAQVLAVCDASKKLRAVWDGFAGTLERLRKEGLQYQTIARAAEDVGIPLMIVTVWQKDGTVIEAWASSPESEQRVKELIGAEPCASITQWQHSSVQWVSELPSVLRQILLACDIEQVYLVPAQENAPERSDPHFILTIFPLTIKPHEDATHAKAKTPRDFWTEHPPVLTALDILGRLSANAHELARNRNLLYLAETAVGMIGHEMRSDASSVVNLSEVISGENQQVLTQLLQNRPISVLVPDVDADPHGNFSFNTLQDPKQIINWLTQIENRIDEYGYRMLRTVDDAIRWARMGGRIIEMQLETISVLKILQECIAKLQRELREKPGIRIVIKESVQKLSNFVADPFLIHNLFVNLLDNAIKYSHNPGSGHRFEIVISAERQLQLVDINFTNWGLGIDEADYTSIFSTFFRSSVRDRLHTVRGVGLGLSECRKIVRLHKGSIKVKSVPTLNDPKRIQAKEGYLTTFTVRLPTNLTEGRVDVDTTKFSL